MEAQDIEWKTVLDYPMYRISNKGEIFNLRRGKPLKNKQTVRLYNNYYKKGKEFGVNRLVFLMFGGIFRFKDLACGRVIHLDKDKTNNNINNLELII